MTGSINFGKKCETNRVVGLAKFFRFYALLKDNSSRTQILLNLIFKR